MQGRHPGVSQSLEQGNSLGATPPRVAPAPTGARSFVRPHGELVGDEAASGSIIVKAHRPMVGGRLRSFPAHDETTLPLKPHKERDA